MPHCRCGGGGPEGTTGGGGGAEAGGRGKVLRAPGAGGGVKGRSRGWSVCRARYMLHATCYMLQPLRGQQQYCMLHARKG